MWRPGASTSPSCAYPYSGQLAEKRRPALVASSNAFNERTGLLWVLMITSMVSPRRSGDVAVPVGGASGLSSPPVVRTTKIATIELGRVLRIAGRLDGVPALLVQRHLANALALE
jgi:mRNA interferase MazF